MAETFAERKARLAAEKNGTAAPEPVKAPPPEPTPAPAAAAPVALAPSPGKTKAVKAPVTATAAQIGAADVSQVVGFISYSKNGMHLNVPVPADAVEDVEALIQTLISCSLG
jgi:hypothetical protein